MHGSGENSCCQQAQHPHNCTELHYLLTAHAGACDFALFAVDSSQLGLFLLRSIVAVADQYVSLQVMDRIHSQFQASTSEVAAVPLHGLSAKTGEGAEHLLPAAMKLYDTWNKRLTTSRLNAWREKV